MREKDIHEKETKIENSWFCFLNDNIGYLCFLCALASLGTNNPERYAGVSFFYITLVYFSRSKPFMNILSLWRETNSPRLRFKNIFKQSHIFLFSYVLLVLVMTGYLK